MLQAMLSGDLFRTLVRYFSVSAGVYVAILASMYLLVDQLHVDKVLGYVVVYAVAYVSEYLMTLTVVFRKQHAWRKVLKFALNTMLFLLIGTVLFKGLLGLHVDYLVATIGVALLLLPFRYLSNRYFVYT